jgi:hypothetical protein
MSGAIFLGSFIMIFLLLLPFYFAFGKKKDSSKEANASTRSKSPRPKYKPTRKLKSILCEDGIFRVDTRGIKSKTSISPRAHKIAGLDSDNWLTLLKAFENKCRYCQTPITINPKEVTQGIRRATKEHTRPLARGGRNEVANIVPSCDICNTFKHICTEEEFLGYMYYAGCPGGFFPEEARTLRANMSHEPGATEDRSLSLMLEIVKAGYPLASYNAPKQAVLIDPPPLDSYNFIKGESWAQSKNAYRVNGTDYYKEAIKAITGSKGIYGGWGYLLPEPYNEKDPGAIQIILEGHLVGYLPKDSLAHTRALATQAWAQGEVPIVRVWASYLSDLALVRIYIEEGKRIVKDF